MPIDNEKMVASAKRRCEAFSRREQLYGRLKSLENMLFVLPQKALKDQVTITIDAGNGNKVELHAPSDRAAATAWTLMCDEHRAIIQELSGAYIAPMPDIEVSDAA